MTVKEMKEKFAGQYADIEVYRFNSKRKSLHTDYVKYVEDYSDDAKVNDVFSNLLDKDDYSSSLLANSTVSWEDYGYEDSDKILVLVLEED